MSLSQSEGFTGLAVKQVYRGLKWTTYRNPVKSLMKRHFTKFGVAILFDSQSRLNLFKSLSLKKTGLTIICQYECRKDQNWAVPIASLRLPILSQSWTSLHTRTDILSLRELSLIMTERGVEAFQKILRKI